MLYRGSIPFDKPGRRKRSDAGTGIPRHGDADRERKQQWRNENREHYREYQREYMRRYRKRKSA